LSLSGREILRLYGLDLSEDAFTKLDLYVERLIHSNLTNIRDLSTAFHKNVAEILLPLKLGNISLNGSLLDVGSGNGVPGLVLAICFPSLQVTLLDSKEKSTKFLEEVVRGLMLENVTVVKERAENFSRVEREKFDYVTARAVARLNVLLELCCPALKIGGIAFFYKGPGYSEELRESGSAAKILGVELEKTIEYFLKTGENRVLVVFRKKEPTPEKFPRRVGVPFKRPLR